MKRSPQQQLVHFVSDMHSVEQQALTQMVKAPEIAGDSELSRDFQRHLSETEEQASRVLKRLEELGQSPSVIKGAIMKLGGKGFLLFAQAMPETPGRLATHAYSYEAMEWAGYEMLARFADRVRDEQTAQMAKSIGAEERAMMERLERDFDGAEAASHSETPAQELNAHVVKHLTEVHAFESQSVKLWDKSESIGGGPTLQALYARQKLDLDKHFQQVGERLAALGSSPSSVKDSALALGGVNWGLFFQAQSDTPAKLAAFAYAVLHLEIAGYELLQRTARRAADQETEKLCGDLISAKRHMAEELFGGFDAAVDATLAELGNA